MATARRPKASPRGRLPFCVAEGARPAASSAKAGSNSHKSIDKSRNWFLRLYYTSRVRLGPP